MGEQLECRSSAGYRLGVENSEQWKMVETAMTGLTTRMRHVMELRLRSYTLQEIGDAIGVTKERVRQIEALALDSIRKALNLKEAP